MLEYLTNAMTATGLFFLAYYGYQLSRFIHLHCIQKSAISRYQHHHSNRSKSMPWAVITGASDGIGRGFAEELLARGFNVVIHGRNVSKLEKLRTILLRLYPDREIRIVVLDAVEAAKDHSATEKLVNEWKAEGLHVTVLINNVGGTGSVEKTWVPLHQRTKEEVDALIDVNTGFPTQFTRAMLPLLYDNKPALIVNMGSVTAQLPSPYLTAYAGSKAYIGAWSRSLKAEMRAEGKEKDIEVLGLTVGAVKAQHDRSEPSFFEPSSRRMAKAALDVVGCGKSDVIAYWPHALQIFLVNLMPNWVVEALMVSIAKERRKIEDTAEENASRKMFQS